MTTIPSAGSWQGRYPGPEWCRELQPSAREESSCFCNKITSSLPPLYWPRSYSPVHNACSHNYCETATINVTSTYNIVVFLPEIFFFFWNAQQHDVSAISVGRCPLITFAFSYEACHFILKSQFLFPSSLLLTKTRKRTYNRRNMRNYWAQNAVFLSRKIYFVEAFDVFSMISLFSVRGPMMYIVKSISRSGDKVSLSQK